MKAKSILQPEFSFTADCFNLAPEPSAPVPSEIAGEWIGRMHAAAAAATPPLLDLEHGCECEMCGAPLYRSHPGLCGSCTALEDGGLNRGSDFL
jgi:hypothetical protein